jgi:ABC-2 type transport system ATP-binding protein
VPVEGGTAAVTAAVRVVEGLGVEVDDIGLRRPTLDEVFLTLTGRPAADDAGDDTYGDTDGDHADEPALAAAGDAA